MEKELTIETDWTPMGSTKLLKSTGKHQKLNTSKEKLENERKKLVF